MMKVKAEPPTTGDWFLISAVWAFATGYWRGGIAFSLLFLLYMAATE